MRHLALARVAAFFALGVVVELALAKAVDEASGVRTGSETSTAGRPPMAHEEAAHDPYVPVPPAEQRTGPAARVSRNGYVSVQVNVSATGNNFLGDAANEPSIAVDPTDPRRMAIGWRQFDTVASNFRQAGYAYTTDGGQTWTFCGALTRGVSGSDPVLASDADGVFYYMNINYEELRLFRSFDRGMTWEGPIRIVAGLADKEWFAIDTTDGIGRGNLYAGWSGKPRFTRSTDGGASFLDPVPDPLSSTLWSTLAVGPDGEVFMVDRDHVVAKSTDAQDPGATPSFAVTAEVDLGGPFRAYAGPNPLGLLGQNWIATDHSNGASRGNVYLLASVNPDGDDPLDVMFARSTDGGMTWSAPVRVNDDLLDNGAWQWFGTMSVAPNGRIDAVWNDTRNDPGGYDSELYYAYSEDAGQTWSENVALSPPWDPHVGWPNQNKIGDYYHTISDDAGAHIAYAATFNGEQDIYYLRIGPTCLDAGNIALDRAKYACESTALLTVIDCGLNVDSQQAETVEVMVDSNSEPGGETVLLTETGPDTARFEGWIPLSATDGLGILRIAEGDTVTATYVDADDGQGGQNVVVSDTAIIDCTPPTISDVRAMTIRPHSAFVTFQSDEPVAATVWHGPACDGLTETATQDCYRPEPAVWLGGLADANTYFYAVGAEDEAGNAATDDAGGLCYTFTTPEAVAYFAERFSEENDLDHLSLTFAPDGSLGFYRGCAKTIAALPTDPAGGTELSLGRDDFVEVVPDGANVTLYGVPYSTFYVGSNGYVTFGEGDFYGWESYWDHFDLPRVSALFDDLDPLTTGEVSWKQLADRVAVSWVGVHQSWSPIGGNTFQIELFFDGVIRISYLEITAPDGLAGLSDGQGLDPEFVAADLSAMNQCWSPGDVNCDGTVNLFDIDPFVLALTATLNEEPAEYYAQWPDCDITLADTDADGTINLFDVDPLVELLVRD